MQRERQTYIGSKITPFKQTRKSIISAEERKRQAKSLVTYKPGGDDIA